MLFYKRVWFAKLHHQKATLDVQTQVAAKSAKAAKSTAADMASSGAVDPDADIFTRGVDGELVIFEGQGEMCYFFT